jgi:hypothetical protein
LKEIFANNSEIDKLKAAKIGEDYFAHGSL